MAARLIDLDDLVPDDIDVKLHDVVYKLPGDIPVELMLRVEAAMQSFGSVKEREEGEAVAGDLLDAVTDLFRIRQPDLETIPIGLRGCVQLISELYKVQGDKPDPPKPAPKRRGGTTSTTRPRAKKPKPSGS